MMDRRPLTDNDKLFPGRPGLQDGPNRKERRREKAVADKPRTLPKSIWKITEVHSAGVAHGMVNHLLYVSRRGIDDRFSVWSKESEGAAPVVGGLLERMSRPTGGEAMIWTDAAASKAGIGGGYTKEAVPSEWAADVDLARAANIEKFNEQYRRSQAGSLFDGPEYRQATIEEIKAAGAGLGLLPGTGMSIAVGAPTPEVDRGSGGKLVVGRAIAAGDINGSKRWNGKEFF